MDKIKIVYCYFISQGHIHGGSVDLVVLNHSIFVDGINKVVLHSIRLFIPPPQQLFIVFLCGE